MEFGTTGIALRDLIDFAKVALGNTNQAVRTNAITMLGTVRQFAGPGRFSFHSAEDDRRVLILDIQTFEHSYKM